MLVFVSLMGAVLYGSYQILVEGLKVTDPGTVAVVFTLIGGIVSQVASLAMQVGNYYYGSSHGSAVKTEIAGARKEWTEEQRAALTGTGQPPKG